MFNRLAAPLFALAMFTSTAHSETLSEVLSLGYEIKATITITDTVVTWLVLQKGPSVFICHQPSQGAVHGCEESKRTHQLIWDVTDR
jgi:hypothetical protein